MCDHCFGDSVTGALRSCDTNQLASNNPCEDHYSYAKCLVNNGWLFGVFDGHGGVACSRFVCGALYDYISASMPKRHRVVNPFDTNTGEFALKYIQWLHSTTAHNTYDPHADVHADMVGKFAKACEHTSGIGYALSRF